MKNNRSRRERVMQMVLLVALCCVPMFVITGCSGEHSLSCMLCGSSATYTPIVAYGMDEELGIEYTSCVGPAGYLGCGCSSLCFPTECLVVSYEYENELTSASICYYDDFGCLDNEGVMSTGYYNTSNTCLGGAVTVSNDTYVENVRKDSVSANQTSYCLGCSYDEQEVEPRYLNEIMPRQYPYGCCTMFYDEEEE